MATVLVSPDTLQITSDGTFLLCRWKIETCSRLWTEKNAYLLPLIPELINKLKGSKIFSKMDLHWGLNNVCIKEGDQWKAAFKTNRGSFKPNVMFFGLLNSPTTFQTMMNSILQDLINDNVVIVYMDDILVYTEDLEYHQTIVGEVLKRLQSNDLFLKPDKCFFEKDGLECLGIIVSNNGIHMDPKKIEGIQDWPVPRTMKQLQGFLCFANFYHQFIKNFSRRATPLHKLLRKDVQWIWMTKHDGAFNDLKEAFTTGPILVFPDTTKPLQVGADASGHAMGAILSMLCDDKKW
jgi:hypothetical protein